jgi:hypothetical protein
LQLQLQISDLKNEQLGQNESLLTTPEQEFIASRMLNIESHRSHPQICALAMPIQATISSRPIPNITMPHRGQDRLGARNQRVA